MNKLLTLSFVSTSVLALGAVGSLKLAAARAAPTLTNPAPTVIPKPPSEPVAPLGERVVVLDELHIVGRAVPPRPTTPRTERRLVPCSGWRAIGPVFSAREGERPRERHVRSMCPAP